MQVYRRKICCLLALFMLISGMCFENIKADSRLVYATVNGSVLSHVQQTTLNMQSKCLPEVAVLRYTPGMRQSMNPVVQVKRDWKIEHILLCTMDISQLLSKFFSTEAVVYIQNTVRHKVVVNYIHRMDGKKRI